VIKTAILSLTLACGMWGQTTPASTLPTDAIFLGASDGNSVYPTFGYAHLLTNSAGGWYSFSQNIITSAKLRPFAITNQTQSGVATPVRTIPSAHLSIYAFGSPGVSSTATATGFSWSYGGFLLWSPSRKFSAWHVAVGYEAVDSTISTAQRAPFVAAVWAK